MRSETSGSSRSAFHPKRLRQVFRRMTAEQRREKKFRQAVKDFDPQAREIAQTVRPYTMLSPEKLFSLLEAVRYIARHDIPGDFVECGVWRGGAVMAAVMALEQEGAGKRTFWLYDTFQGMPAPTDKDARLVGQRYEDDVQTEFERRRTGEDSSDWCFAGIDEVKANIARLGVDPDKDGRFRFVPGKVEDTIPASIPERIALLRLDTDWYESTRHELLHLMPRLVSRGVLIIDDYHGWAGNRQAVDEYLEAHELPILLTRAGKSVVGVKP